MNERDEKKIYDIAVIGGGGAGQMGVLRAALNNMDTIMFTGDANAKRRSRATWVATVENIPGFFDLKKPIAATTKGVLNFVQSHPNFATKLELVKSAVTTIEKQDELFVLGDGNAEYVCRYVLLCTGTMDVQPLINGSIEPVFPYANRGDIDYCIRCDGHKTIGKNCAIIGHSSSTVHIAVMLLERYDLPGMWILTNGKELEASQTERDLIDLYDIQVREGEIDEIVGDPKTAMEGFRVAGELIPTPKAFVALGSIVYNELAKSLGVKMNKHDHLVTDKKGETSVPGFYAAGDLVGGKKKQVYTAWDSAVDAVDAIDAKNRARKREERVKSRK